MDGLFRFRCSACGKRLKARPADAGRKGSCSCGYAFRIPKLGIAVSPTPHGVRPSGAPRVRVKIASMPSEWDEAVGSVAGQVEAGNSPRKSAFALPAVKPGHAEGILDAVPAHGDVAEVFPIDDQPPRPRKPPFHPVSLAPAAWASLAVSGLVVLAFMACLIMAQGNRRPIREEALPTLLLLHTLAEVACYVWFLVGMYRTWKYVLDWMNKARLPAPVGSAGAAVGYLFIPIYNIGWIWKFFGVPDSLNRVIRANDLHVQEADNTPGQCYCLFVLLSNLAFTLGGRVPIAVAGAVVCLLVAHISLIVFAHNLQRTLNAVGRQLGGAR
jgi:hypothetical protein